MKTIITHVQNYLDKNDKDHISMIAGQAAFLFCWRRYRFWYLRFRC